MPQASNRLRNEWNGAEYALAHLGDNIFQQPYGTIRPRGGYTLTEKDKSAIDYLIREWDFAFQE